MDNLKLIDLLVQNPRASITDLADILGETEESVNSAKKELEDKKIICGYHTLINWNKTNNEKVIAMIEVRVTPQRGQGFDRIAERIYNFSEVNSVYLISGGFDGDAGRKDIAGGCYVCFRQIITAGIRTQHSNSFRIEKI